MGIEEGLDRYEIIGAGTEGGLCALAEPAPVYEPR